MNNRQIIYKSIDILENSLHENISVEELSKKMGFSKYYFSRLFKAVTGYTPKHYYLSRRISEAAIVLLSCNKKIIEIALDFGFNSPEVFTRSFTQMFYKSPSEARKNGIDKSLLLSRKSQKELNAKEHALDKEPRHLTLPALHLVGIQFYHDLSYKNDLSKQWDILMSHLDEIKNKIQPLKFYQFQYWFDEMSDEMFFFCAVAVKSPLDVPMQMSYKEIPSQEYLLFRHKGKANEVGYTYSYIFDEWLPDSKNHLPSLFNFEYYGEEYLGPYNDKSISEIYIPLKKALN